MKRVVTISEVDLCESAVVRGQVIGNTVVTMAGFGFTAAELANALYAFISVHTAPINFLCTGDPPMALFGHELATGESILIGNNTDINNLQFIRTTAIDSNVTATLKWNLG